MCFKRHPDGRWGLEPQRWPDGRSDFWRPLNEQEKPWLLRGQDHGTQVVLLGQHERHDTTQPPDSVSDAHRHWITRYLNARFLRLPDQVEVLVREQHGHDQPGQLQRIHGEQHHLQQRAIAAGTVQLSDATARWWVLDDDHRARRREGTLWASTGHAAAVYGDELYDILPQTRGGYGRLQDFGIRFGYERVVLAGARSSPPRCLPRSCGCKNEQPARMQSRARRRSASASPRSCRSTASAATAQAHHPARHPSSPRPTSATSRPTRPPPSPRRHA